MKHPSLFSKQWSKSRSCKTHIWESTRIRDQIQFQISFINSIYEFQSYYHHIVISKFVLNSLIPFMANKYIFPLPSLFPFISLSYLFPFHFLFLPNTPSSLSHVGLSPPLTAALFSSSSSSCSLFTPIRNQGRKVSNFTSQSSFSLSFPLMWSHSWISLGVEKTKLQN